MKKTVLIFNLDGGTFNVSLFQIKDGTIEVKATSGDTQLGGEDFDSRMVDYFVQDFKKKHSVDMRRNRKSLRPLRSACEKAKRALSFSPPSSIDIDSMLSYVSR